MNKIIYIFILFYVISAALNSCAKEDSASEVDSESFR